MHGLEDLIKIIKDNNLLKLLKNKKYFSIIIGKYPYHVKKEILNSNEELKQWFKELVEKRHKYLCELVNNNSFLIYQLSLLYYNLFNEVPNELLKFLDPENLLFDFEYTEKKLCGKYLNEIIIPKNDCIFDELTLTIEVIKLIIPVLSIIEDPFYDFENNMRFWYMVWVEFGKEFSVKALKLSIKNNYINSYFVKTYKNALKLVFDLILEDERLLEHFNPFFFLGFKNRIGHYCDMNVVPLFLGSKEVVLSLFVDLLLKINKKAGDYDCTTIERAGDIIELCKKAIENYPEYYKERKNGLGSFESSYYNGVQKLTPNDWMKFTVYGIVLKLSEKYPPMIKEEQDPEEYLDEVTRLGFPKKNISNVPSSKNIQEIFH